MREPSEPISAPPWRAHFESLARQGYKVSACRRDGGYCLDVSEAWDGVQADMKRDLLGLRYLEYIHPQFLKPFLKWALGDDRCPYAYPAMMLRPCDRVPMILGQTRYSVREVNIFIGATERISNPAVLRKLRYDTDARMFCPS